MSKIVSFSDLSHDIMEMIWNEKVKIEKLDKAEESARRNYPLVLDELRDVVNRRLYGVYMTYEEWDKYGMGKGGDLWRYVYDELDTPAGIMEHYAEVGIGGTDLKGDELIQSMINEWYEEKCIYPHYLMNGAEFYGRNTTTRGNFKRLKRNKRYAKTQLELQKRDFHLVLYNIRNLDKAGIRGGWRPRPFSW